jgi:hypothetical protein
VNISGACRHIFAFCCCFCWIVAGSGAREATRACCGESRCGPPGGRRRQKKVASASVAHCAVLSHHAARLPRGDCTTAPNHDNGHQPTVVLLPQRAALVWRLRTCSFNRAPRLSSSSSPTKTRPASSAEPTFPRSRGSATVRRARTALSLQWQTTRTSSTSVAAVQSSVRTGLCSASTMTTTRATR